MTLTPTQLAQRRTGIGGSDVAAVLGVSPYRRPIDVYLDKLGEADPVEDNEAMRWGRILEPVVLAEYERRNEVVTVPSPGTLRHPTRLWQLASPDAILMAGSRRLRVIEIKARGFRAGETYGDPGTDQVPPADLLQGAWYMSCLDIPRCDYAILTNTHTYREYVVERDQELEDHVLEQVERFWLEHVERRVPPLPDGSDAFRRYLQGRFARTRGEYLTPPDDLLPTIVKLRTLRGIERGIAKVRPELEQRIQDAIGDADGFQLGEKEAITFRFDARGRVNYKALLEEAADAVGLTKDELRELEDRFREPPPRRFLLPRSWSKDELDLSALVGDAGEEF